jgi:SRSO17 transposase
MSTEISESNEQSLSHFISNSPWDDEALREVIAKDAVDLLSKDGTTGCLIIDESGIPKQGRDSVGVSRQYCGRIGKVDNCQVGVFLAYCSSDLESTLIDTRLYLPESWCNDSKRCDKAGIPEDHRQFKMKTELALELILNARDKGIKFEFASMDGFYGESPWLLSAMENENIIYMADIACDTRVYLEYPKLGIPERQGDKGRLPSKIAVLEGKPIAVKDLLNSSNVAWKTLKIRDTQRGELWIHFSALRVWRIVDGIPHPKAVWLAIRKELDGSGIKYSLCNAPESISLEVLAEWQSRRYWVERSLEDAKGLSGLDEYQFLGWKAWYHHMTMIMLAMLFLHTLKNELSSKAPLFSLQDAKRILEQVMPKKALTREETIDLIYNNHSNRYSSRESSLKKQKQSLELSGYI